MNTEKSLRSGTAFDDQFIEFVESEDAVITITVESSIRQVGKLRLAAMFAEFLKQQGYTSVKINEHILQALNPFLPDPLVENQKKVQIHIDVK